MYDGSVTLGKLLCVYGDLSIAEEAQLICGITMTGGGGFTTALLKVAFSFSFLSLDTGCAGESEGEGGIPCPLVESEIESGGEGVSEQDGTVETLEVMDTGFQGLSMSRSEAGVGSDELIGSLYLPMESSTVSTGSRLSLFACSPCEADELLEEVEALGDALDIKALKRLLSCIEKRDIALEKETQHLAAVERKYTAAQGALEARESVLEELGKVVETLEGMSETAKEFARQSERGQKPMTGSNNEDEYEEEKEDEEKKQREEEDERLDIPKALRELERKVARLVQTKAEGVDSRLLASCLVGLLDELADLGAVEDSLS